jgi:hypothetical protein
MNIQPQKPVVFACADCSAAGRLAYEVALELDRRQAAEMSCLAADLKPFTRLWKGGRCGLLMAVQLNAAEQFLTARHGPLTTTFASTPSASERKPACHPVLICRRLSMKFSVECWRISLLIANYHGTKKLRTNIRKPLCEIRTRWSIIGQEL